MRSTSAMRGSLSCFDLKLVCIAALLASESRIHAPRIENAGGIEGGLHSARKLFDARLEWLKHLHACTHLRLGADQRGVPAVGGDDAADVGGACIGGGQHL